MAFTSQRGRPRKLLPIEDAGTPEFRLKHALRLTAEPIDLCLEKKFITAEQHWCGLHLRWLYTIRYGAPKLTITYIDTSEPLSRTKEDEATWKKIRETEYKQAICALKKENKYEAVMRLAVYNEFPAFLNAHLQDVAGQKPALNQNIKHIHDQLCNGLDLLVHLWRKQRHE